MENDIRELLEENLHLARENNRLLKKMHRAAVINQILQLAYWAIIIGLPIALYYYFLQPYIGQFIKNYQNIRGSIDTTPAITEQLPQSPI